MERLPDCLDLEAKLPVEVESKEKVRIITDLFGKEHALRTSRTNRCASTPFPR